MFPRLSGRGPPAGPVGFPRAYDEPTMTAFDRPTVTIWRRGDEAAVEVALAEWESRRNSGDDPGNAAIKELAQLRTAAVEPP